MERNTSSHNTISRIDFCLLGMPTRIQFTNGSVTEYIYAADGTKLRTIHRTSVNGPAIPYGTRHTLTNQETLSLDSITYIDCLEIDKFFNFKYYFDNGYLTLGNTGSGEYHYTIKDHLGNIRTVVDASGSAEQVNNYYAYGGMLNDVPASVDVQTHKYNGKELDLMHGLNEYDYGARQYDPAIAQFTTVDPLCEKYYHISPYVYCGSNPVNRVDPDGKDWHEKEGERKWFNSVDDVYTDKKHNKWTNIGHTYTDSKSGMYYSLFGQEYEKGNKDLQAIKTIDNALLLYAEYESEIASAYKKHEYTDIPEPTFNFSKMYPFVRDNSVLRMESPNIHPLAYGDDSKYGNNTTVCQVGNREMAQVKLFERFKYMDKRGYNGTSLKGYGIVFINKSGKDLVSIILRPKRAIILQSFYNKLVNSFN